MSVYELSNRCFVRGCASEAHAGLLRTVVSAVLSFSEFALLGSVFRKELRLTEEIHWPLHMRKSQCVCLNSGLENVSLQQGNITNFLLLEHTFPRALGKCIFST